MRRKRLLADDGAVNPKFSMLTVVGSSRTWHKEQQRLAVNLFIHWFINVLLTYLCVYIPTYNTHNQVSFILPVEDLCADPVNHPEHGWCNIYRSGRYCCPVAAQCRAVTPDDEAYWFSLLRGWPFWRTFNNTSRYLPQLMKPAAKIQNEITDHATTATIDLIDRKK